MKPAQHLNNLALALALILVTGCANFAPRKSPPQPFSHQSVPAVQAAPSSPTIYSATPYNRKDWGQWADEDRNCRNTRQEILVQESLSPVTFSRANCTVKTGQWQDFYTGETFFKASQVEIDHVVPLKHAHDLGGYNWPKSKKRQFYNDRDNLVITSKRNNASKGANDITVWQPANKTRACAQAKRWILIKTRYSLPISTTEREYTQLLAGCF